MSKQYSVLLRNPRARETSFRAKHYAHNFGRLPDDIFNTESRLYEYAMFNPVTSTYRRFMNEQFNETDLCLHKQNGALFVPDGINPVLNFCSPLAVKYITAFLAVHAIGLHYRTKPFPRPVDGVLIDVPIYQARYDIWNIAETAEIESPEQFEEASSAVWGAVTERCGFDIIVNGSSSWDMVTNSATMRAALGADGIMVEVAIKKDQSMDNFEAMVSELPDEKLKFFGILGGSADWAASVARYYGDIKNAYWMHRTALTYREQSPIFEWGYNPIL